MADPSIAADGITYERELIEQWLVEHNESPVTGCALEHRQVVVNTNLRILLEEYLSRHERSTGVGIGGNHSFIFNIVRLRG